MEQHCDMNIQFVAMNARDYWAQSSSGKSMNARDYWAQSSRGKSIFKLCYDRQ
jgi:hypothetical protein